MVQAPQEDWGSLLAAPQAEDDWGSLLTTQPPKPHSRKTGWFDLLGAARSTGQFLESNLEQAVRGAEMATGQAAEFIGTHGEKALNALFPGELTQAGKAARVQAAGEPGRAIQAQAQTHPEPQGYAQKLSGAAGGLVPYITAEALTGGAATLPILGTMGGQHVDAAYEQAKAAGANEATATLAGLANVPGAIAMTLPLGRVLGRLSKEAPEVGTVLQEALRSAAAGTLGMGGARVAGEFVHEKLTGQDREILSNALEGASLDAPIFALLGAAAGKPQRELTLEEQTTRALESRKALKPGPSTEIDRTNPALPPEASILPPEMSASEAADLLGQQFHEGIVGRAKEIMAEPKPEAPTEPAKPRIQLVTAGEPIQGATQLVGMEGVTAKPTPEPTTLPDLPEEARRLVYHGTPHTFEKFDVSKVGTGEGAQAFGHGLYFTDKKEIAQYYQKKLSQPGYLSGKSFDLGHEAMREAEGEGLSGREAFDRARQILNNKMLAESGPLRGHYQDAANNLDSILNNKGNLHEVALAPKESELLDWDKPLSEQSDMVKAGIDATIADMNAERANRGLQPVEPTSVLASLSAWYGNEGASRALLRHGVRGIRYSAEAGTRASMKPEGGGPKATTDEPRNYVIFSDKDVEIVKPEAPKAPPPLPISPSAEGAGAGRPPGASTLYHGTSKQSARALLRSQAFDLGRIGTGADKNFVQGKVGAFGLGQGAGFFGKGVYLTSSADLAKIYAEARKSGLGDVLRVDLSKDVLDVTDRKRVIPDIERWWTNHVAERRQVLGKSEMTPHDLHEAFISEVSDWESGFVNAVSQYAKANGYPGVKFSDSEIVITDPSIISKISRIEKGNPAKPSRDRGTRGALDLFGPRRRADPNAETDMDRLYSGLVFDLHRIQQLAERAPNQPKLKETMEETLSLFPGRKFGEMEKIDKQVVAPLKPLLREIGPDEAADYLMAKHVPDALKELERKGVTNPSVGMDPAQAAEIVSKAENGPKAEAYKRLRAWNQMSNKRALDTMERGFLISPETRKEWESRFGPDFVHLKSVPDPQAEEFFGPGGFTVSGPESNRREGRESKAGNPIAFRLMSLEQAVVRSEKNRIGNTLAAFVEANPGKLWRIVTDRNKVGQGEETLPYKVNGEQRYIVTGDKPLAQAFRRLIDPDPGVLRVVDPALNWLHNVIIKWNPGFQAYNIPRDVGTASSKQLMRGDFQAAAKTVAQAVPAAKGAFQAIRTEGAGGHWGDVYRRARDAGALIGWNQQLGYEKQIDAFEKATRPEGKARAFGQLMDDLNRAGELGTRLVTFEAALQNGKSESAAAMDARRITADFARRGRWAPVYRRLYLFSGANIQGTAELARSTAQNPVKAASVFGALIAAGYTSAALSHAFGDEKELEKLTPDEKDRFIGVMIGKRRYGVPAPYGFNFFTSLGWGLYDAQTGRDKGKVLADALDSGLNAFSPLPRAANTIQAVTPTLGRPLVEIAQNRDFSNRPIKPEVSPFDVSPPPEHERYFRTVSPVSKSATQALAETTGIEVSPEIVDHLAKAVTGGLGTFGGRTLENARKVLNGETAGMRLQDWPGVGEAMRPFIREAPPSAQSSLMWATVKKVQAVEGKIKDELKAGGERAAAAHKQMSQPEVRGAIQAAAFFKVIDKSLATLRKARDSATTDEAKKDAERRIEDLQSRFLDQARKFGVRLEMD